MLMIGSRHRWNFYRGKRFLAILLLVSSWSQTVLSQIIDEPLSKSNSTLISLSLLTEGVERPVGIIQAEGNAERYYVLEQSGRIRVYENNSLQPQAFLDISDRISCCRERGLLGVALHPNFTSTGEFFANYTDAQGNTVVARYTATNPSAEVNPDTEQILLSIAQPFSNHNGGALAFGPDGYLYIATGDGGSGGDPQNNSQNRQSLLGKMLRIDVDNAATFNIPTTNPFANEDFTLDEIWALGLRNPFRFSFDKSSGDLYIADVGQDAIEEVHVHKANTAAGENYGWRLMEGSRCFNPGSNCNDGSLTLPAFEYSHQGDRCSITGGYVYRGNRIAGLRGKYIYGDFCTGEIFAAEFDSTMEKWGQEVILNSNLEISSFGESSSGELFVVDINGAIYSMVSPLVIYPASGTYTRGQSIDLGFVLRGQNTQISDFEVTLNGADISSQFRSCEQVEALQLGNESRRCAGIGLEVLEAGEHRLGVNAVLEDGTRVSDLVEWEVLE